MGAFDLPPVAERTAPPVVLAEGVSGLPSLGIEVTQVVQDLQNSVTLVAGKTTVVRVYLDATALDPVSATVVRGVLAWRRSGTAEAYLASLNGVALEGFSPKALGAQRLDVSASLNFELPAEAVVPGRVLFRLADLHASGGDGVPPAGITEVAVEFLATPPLIVRVVGLRYLAAEGPGSPVRAVSPDAVHFDYLRSYLQRAYPVSAIEWSQIVVDADFAPPFDNTFPSPSMTAALANAQLVALRSREVDVVTQPGELLEVGFDPRTHYYGLVSDDAGRNFMVGMTMLQNGHAGPDLPGSGPAGVPRSGYMGDVDASFADWYGAHEIGHSFGRRHPGFPPDQQASADPAFPFPNGQISTDDERYVGFDVGDPSLGLPMAALPGTVCHDIMTYSPRQWLSAYTYESIRARLLREAGVTDPATAAVGGPFAVAPEPQADAVTDRSRSGRSRFVSIVASVDLNARTGRILYLNPSSAAITGGIPNDRGVELQVNDEAGGSLLRLRPSLLFGACDDPLPAGTALVKEDMPVVQGMHEVLLLVDGQARSRHVAGPVDPAAADDIAISEPLPGRPHRRTVSRTPGTKREGITYTVQARTAGDSRWETVAVGRETPDVEVDVNQFPGAARVEVLVLATNGFDDRVVATEEIIVGELEPLAHPRAPRTTSTREPRRSRR